MFIDDIDLDYGLSVNDRVIALRWEHLTEEERLGVLIQMEGMEYTLEELYAGYYLRASPDTVVYVEPAEVH